jgi:hypothetical protein
LVVPRMVSFTSLRCLRWLIPFPRVFPPAPLRSLPPKVGWAGRLDTAWCLRREVVARRWSLLGWLRGPTLVSGSAWRRLGGRGLSLEDPGAWGLSWEDPGARMVSLTSLRCLRWLVSFPGVFPIGVDTAWCLRAVPCLRRLLTWRPGLVLVAGSAGWRLGGRGLPAEVPGYCGARVSLCRPGTSWLGGHASLPAVRVLLVAWDHRGVLQVLSCRGQGS